MERGGGGERGEVEEEKDKAMEKRTGGDCRASRHLVVCQHQGIMQCVDI